MIIAPIFAAVKDFEIANVNDQNPSEIKVKKKTGIKVLISRTDDGALSRSVPSQTWANL